MRSPSMATSPSVAGIKPAMMFRAVDLPHPLGPRKVTNCLPRISSAKSRSTVFVPKRLVIRNCSESIVSFMCSHRCAKRGSALRVAPPPKVTASSELLLLDLLRADLPVPAVHRVRQLLEVELRRHLVLLGGADLVVLGPPVLLDEVPDLRWRLVEGRGLDGRADEGL